MQRELKKIYDLMFEHSSESAEVVAALKNSKFGPAYSFRSRFRTYREAEQEQMALALYHEAVEMRGCLWKPLIVFLLFVLSVGTSLINEYAGVAALIILIPIAIFMWFKIPQEGLPKKKLVVLAPLMIEYLKYANPENRTITPPKRFIADAHDAEVAAAEFMRWLGFYDAYEMPIGPDGGIDIQSTNAVGQVKDYGVPVGRPALQQHLGVATSEGGKLPIFFARSGYTAQAVEYANSVTMVLFEFNLSGEWASSNKHAESLLEAGAERFLDIHGVGSNRLKARAKRDSTKEVNPTPKDKRQLELNEEANIVEQIQELVKLRDSGALSEREFESAKKKLLG